MFSLAAKILKRATRYPVFILVTSLILAALCYFPISNLHWDLQLQDVISSKDSRLIDFKKIEQEFGGLGSLTVVLNSKDSLANYNVAKNLAESIKNDPLVHFVEFETDVEFYKKHSLLYVEEKDLDTIVSRLESIRKTRLLASNPLFVDLEDSSSKASKSVADEFKLQDIEQKYASLISKSHANENGTIRVIDIYPKHPLSDLQAGRLLFSKVKDCLNKNEAAANIQIHYTGKVFDLVQTGKTLLPEAKFAGKITALFILILLIIHFYRKPQLIIISAIPVGLPILYTLALAGLIYGRINLITLLLALLLPGGACQVIVHVLNRYFIERSQNLGPQLSIESAVLGIGPSTAASTGVMATLFATLLLVPIQGLHELAVLGAIGSVLNWIVTILVTTSLLLIFQKKKEFSVNSSKLNREYKLTRISYRANIIMISIISVISLVCIIYGGMNLKFFYDFSKMEIPRQSLVADSLIRLTGFPDYNPVVVQLNDPSDADELYRDFNRLKAKNAIPTISHLYTLAQFSPKQQAFKKEKLNRINEIIDDEFISKLDSAERHRVEILQNLLADQNLDIDEQPENIRNKFSDIHGNIGKYAFIFSNINPNDGLACRHLAKDIQKLTGLDDGTFRTAGTSVLRAQILDLVLQNLDKAIFVGTIMVWLFMLLYYNRLSRAIFTMLPSIFAISWLLMLIRIFGIELSVYSSLAFPILIGASVDGSFQLWAAFYEKDSGTALTILQRKFSSIAISQMASLIGSYGLIISSHPGLRSIGQISLIGLLCIFTAQFTIFPIIAGSLDNYRILQKKKKALK